MKKEIREYAYNLLKEHGCSPDCYAADTFQEGYTNALSDLETLDIKYPYSVKRIAIALAHIGMESKGPKPYIFPDFNDWGHYGITPDATSLYDKGESLRKAIKSEKPFDTGWHGFKKDLQSMRIKRRRDLSYEVFVSEEIDSPYEDAALIYDCLRDDEIENLTEDMVEEIQNILMNDYEFRDNEKWAKIISKDSSIEDILESASFAAYECRKRLHESFLKCMGVTLFVLYGYPEDSDFINRRINAEKMQA